MSSCYLVASTTPPTYDTPSSDGLPRPVRTRKPILDRLYDPEYKPQLLSFVWEMYEQESYFEQWFDDSDITQYIEKQGLSESLDEMNDLINEFFTNTDSSELIEDALLDITRNNLFKAINRVFDLSDTDVAENPYFTDNLKAYDAAYLLARAKEGYAPIVVTGGMSWGDSPTDSFDDILLIDMSGIFDKSFPSE